MEIIRREDAERMIVWDDMIRKDARIVLAKLDDGSCIAVIESDENRFYNGKDFGVLKWEHCEDLEDV